MFKRLKQKWQVSWWQFTFIFITFALGGSLCGFAGKRLLALTTIVNPWVRIPLYIILLTLLWPFCVLGVSVVFGQFSFFKKFLSRLGRRLRGQSSSKA